MFGTQGSVLRAYNKTIFSQESPINVVSELRGPPRPVITSLHLLWFTSNVPEVCVPSLIPQGWPTKWQRSQTLGKTERGQTELHNSKQKQMQRHSSVYNWFSRPTSCCHSLSNESAGWCPVAHQPQSVSRGRRSPLPTPIRMAPCGKPDITPWIFHSGNGLFLGIRLYADLFSEDILSWSKYSKPPGKTWWLSQLLQRFPQTTGIVKPLWPAMFMSEITHVFVGFSG